MSQQRGDGSWQAAPGIEVQSTAATLNALTNAGISRGYSLGAAVTWLQNADAFSVDALSRRIIALKAVSADMPTDLTALTALQNQPSQATWGAYGGYDTSFPDTPLALAALRTQYTTYSNQTLGLANSVYYEIFPSQRSNGRWSFMKMAGTDSSSVSGGHIADGPDYFGTQGYQRYRLGHQYMWDHLRHR